MVKVFEILEHTADIGFRAWGDAPAELFANAALALQSIAVEATVVNERFIYPIAAAGGDYETLLVNWLNELLYYLDGERVVMSRFQIDQISPERVSGKGWGEQRDPARHAPKLVVKGVTYHQLAIKEEEGRWSAQVFLDV
ncbi:MAG: archease [Bryobacteraceae bacterium]|nr:archease [Bryobacteraceae bacterium]